MTEAALTTHRRAQSVALFGLLTQFVVLAVTLAIWVFSHATALAIVACHLGGALPIWLVVLMYFTQKKRAEIEKLETEELRREKGLTSERLFELDDEALLAERRRLMWIGRWVLPATSIVLVVYHALVVWYWYSTHAKPLNDPIWHHASQPSIVIWFIGGVCFTCFLLSRYASGMSRQPEWRLMRTAAAYLTGNALGCLLVVIAMAMSIYGVPWGEPLAVWCIGATMLVITFEFLVNLILDLYRPRIPGEEVRPAFDSRLLGLFTEPGGIARSIAEAVNYQFGFEVSTTWFYQLLQRSVLWLMLFMVLVLWGLSSLLVVDADEEVIVERFGRRVADQAHVLGPGLHFKLPWPMEIAYRAPVRRLNSLEVWKWQDKKKGRDEHEESIILWTDDHKIAEETLLLVAGPHDSSAARLTPPGGSTEGKSVSIALIHASAVVHYRIKNIMDYLYTYAEPEAVVESTVRRILSEYAASTELAYLIGPGRERFDQILTQKLQAEVERLKLGIDVVFVALQDAHPPSTSEVAKTFQDVVSAERRKEAAIEEARGRAQRIKTQAAGSVALADAMDSAIRDMERIGADAAATAEERAAASAKVDGFLNLSGARGAAAQSGDGTEFKLSGEAAKLIADARADAVREIGEVASKVRVMDDELAAYRANPMLYRMRKWIAAVVDNVQDIRKYIVAADGRLVITLESEGQKDFDFSALETDETASGAVR